MAVRHVCRVSDMKDRGRLWRGRRRDAAAFNSVLAGLAVVVALKLSPGPEFSLALDMRRSAIRAVEEDLYSQVIAHEPFPHLTNKPAIDAMVSAILVPLIATLVEALRKWRSQSGDAPKSETQ